ncbi:LAGLIDADG family homing endonuclease [Alteromonas stellipolaris]|uniref:LAGLIDADG family homing endonuclease n=1 Tax=Alteromonas stellipolaris TaxID=233316 RepID=UPI002734B81F|nr:LAGLIDADG family homing endonuclease [Alteromonas stellipolaris]MDP2595140.1 LAGLIDADG family homing endonuclease [Alteromonas stellipolaris]
MTKRSRRASKLTRAEYEEIYNFYYVRKGLGCGAIGKEIGVSKSSVFRNFNKYGFQVRSNSEGSKLSNQKWSDEEIATIHQHCHIKNKMTFEEIAEVHGISPAQFSARCAELGLQVRSQAEAMTCFWEKRESEIREMYEYYLDGAKISKEIASELGCSTSQVYRCFKHFEYQMKSPKGSNLTDKDKFQIVELYSDERAPREIEENLGISSSTVRKVLKEIGVELRPLDEAVNLALARGRDKTRNSINANIKLDFFEQMTPELAWFLGAVCSDGSIGSNYGLNKTTSSFSLASIDKDFVEKLGALVGLSPSKSIQSTSSKQIWTLRCSNKHFVSHLEGLGVCNNKSSTVTIPEAIRPELMRHFIRGYFEGDGCVCVNLNGRVRFSLSSKSRRLIMSVAKELYEQAGIGIQSKRRSLSCVNLLNCPYLTVYVVKEKSDLIMYKIETSALSMIEKLYRYLYEDVDEANRMNRKFNKFEKALGGL